MSYGGSSGGNGKIATAGDVAFSNPAANQLLMYNASTQKWVNASLQSIISLLPTSSTGLAVGSLWLNNGVLTVVTGSTGAPAVTMSNVSSSVTTGSPITGTVTLSNTSTVYLVLYANGSEQGSRVSTNGGSFSLTPGSAGTYTVRAYTASSGGSLLTESPSVNVAAAATASVSFSGLSSTSVGGNVSGKITLSNISTAFISLYTSGAEQGSRKTVSNGSSLSSLSPTAAGSYTVRAFTASTGGSLIGESASFTVSAASGSLISPAFYVSPSGNDSNAGTASSPFATFEKAQTAMRAGSTKTAYLRGGTFNRSSKFSMNQSDNGTTWIAYPGETPVIDGGGSVTDVVWMDYHSANITWNGVTFQNCKGCAVHLSGYITGSDDGTITGVVIKNCTFQNITDNGQYGAGNSGAIRGTFATKSNTITQNLFQNMFGPGVSFSTGGAPEISQGNKVTYNKFINCNTGMADSSPVYFMDRSHNPDPSNPTVIDHNYVQYGGGETETKLFYLDDEMSYVNVTNNIFCGQSHWALQLHGSDHVNISNNIFDISDQKWPNDYLLGLYQDDVGAGFTNYGMAGNTFTKNIVYNAAASTYKQSSMWQWQDNTNGGIAKPSVSNNIYYWGSGTLPAGAGTITDSSPKYINPNLKDPANRDYSFTSTTNANQIGFTAIDQSVMGPQ